jgi:hypothetical protein
MPRFLLLLPLLLLAEPAASETCVTYGGSQFYNEMHVCVSSPLADQGGNSYGPANLGDWNPATAWCEDTRDHGAEQWVEVRWSDVQTFRTILIRNGYAKSDRSYASNSRPRLVRITTDDGLETQVELLDQAAEQRVSLPRTVQARAIRLTVVSTYPGSSYTDTCMDEISIDLEELNY